MKTFYGISKPSQAIRAMIRGLLKNSEREDFKVNMLSFGHFYSFHQICYGCAANCALQELSGISFTKEIARRVGHCLSGELSTFGTFLGDEQREFETAIDCARMGSYDNILEFFGVEDPKLESRPILSMTSDNWRKQIAVAEKLAESWEADNL